MGKLEETIALIESQGEKYKKHSNEWNVMQQLIDILADDPQSAEIVYQDLQVEEMKLPKLVSKVTGKRIGDPEKVMRVICDFYKIPCPAELPPEHWRTNEAALQKPVTKAPSLLDLL